MNVIKFYQSFHSNAVYLLVFPSADFLYVSHDQSQAKVDQIALGKYLPMKCAEIKGNKRERNKRTTQNVERKFSLYDQHSTFKFE